MKTTQIRAHGFVLKVALALIAGCSSPNQTSQQQTNQPTQRPRIRPAEPQPTPTPVSCDIPQGSDPKLTLSSTSISPGETVTFTVTGLAAEAGRVDFAVNKVALRSVKVGSNGSATSKLDVWAVGAVTATWVRFGCGREERLVLTSTVTARPTTAPPSTAPPSATPVTT